MELAKQLTRYKRSAKVEKLHQTLSAEAMQKDGQAARKRRKQLSERMYIPQVISSRDFSDKGNMRKTANKSQQGNVRPIGNKTDVKINSYWSSKRGDNMPKDKG